MCMYIYIYIYVSRHLQPLKPLCRHIRQEFEEGELEFGDEEFWVQGVGCSEQEARSLKMETTVVYMMGLYRDSGKENGKYYSIRGYI